MTTKRKTREVPAIEVKVEPLPTLQIDIVAPPLPPAPKPRRYVPPPCRVCGSSEYVYVNGTERTNSDKELITVRHIRCSLCASVGHPGSTFPDYEIIKHPTSTVLESAN